MCRKKNEKVSFLSFLLFCFLYTSVFFWQIHKCLRNFPKLYIDFCRIFCSFKRNNKCTVDGFSVWLNMGRFSTDIFGVRTVMFTAIGYLAGRFYRNFDSKKIFTQVVMIFFAGAVYWSGVGLIYFVFPDNGNRAFSFSILLVFFKIVVTAMFAPLVFYILEKMDIIYQKLRRD